MERKVFRFVLRKDPENPKVFMRGRKATEFDSISNIWACSSVG